MAHHNGQPSVRPLLDAAGTARQLGLFNSEGEPLASWVLAQARADRIPHVRLGHYVRFDADEIAAWASQRARGPRFDRKAP